MKKKGRLQEKMRRQRERRQREERKEIEKKNEEREQYNKGFLKRKTIIFKKLNKLSINLL